MRIAAQDDDMYDRAQQHLEAFYIEVPSFEDLCTLLVASFCVCFVVHMISPSMQPNSNCGMTRHGTTMIYYEAPFLDLVS